MNRTSQLLTLGAALLLAPLTSAFGQSTWETVDSLTPWRGRDIVADRDGNFVSIAIDNGAAGTPGIVSTAVSLSADHGATWQDVGFIAGYAIDLTVAPDGALFATGNRSATVTGRAFCWQSLDHGATWTVSDPSVGLTTVLIVSDVAAGNTDSIYVSGTSSGRWMIRKGIRTANGITWSTVDNPAISGLACITVRPGLAGQPDEILACGGGWTVRRSTDSGATWTSLNSPGGAYSTQNATAAIVAPDGAICVVGMVQKTVGTRKTGYTTEGAAVIRRSTNGGATWSETDYVVNYQPESLAVDAFGRVFSAGIRSGSPTTTWLVRGSTDGGVSWVTTDSFPPTSTTRAVAYSVAIDALGNVCVHGETGSTAATYAALIRRLAVP